MAKAANNGHDVQKSGYIAIRNVRKSFRDQNGRVNEVLKGIDLDVRKGEVYGIIGFSGAGKSTLARCINRLEEPDSGSIVIDGVDVLGLSKDELRTERRRVGMIFQTFNLFDSKTVYDNIAFPLCVAHVPKADVPTRVRAAAEVVGLEEKLSEYPGALSGGQKQRVGIARAIVSNPSVLLSDEATSALDPQTTIQILDLLKEINQRTGLTILMITHELEAIKYSCRRVAVLEDGRVVESGLADEVFSNPQSRTGAVFTKVYSQLQTADATGIRLSASQAGQLDALSGAARAHDAPATPDPADLLPLAV